MEDMQLEERMDWLAGNMMNKFIVRYIDPIHLSIEDKMKFESLLDQQAPILSTCNY